MADLLGDLVRGFCAQVVAYAEAELLLARVLLGVAWDGLCVLWAAIQQQPLVAFVVVGCVLLYAPTRRKSVTVKITKKGSLPTPNKYSLRCPKCATEFECLQTDMEYDGTSYNGSPSYRIGCPMYGCDQKIVCCSDP